MRRSLLFFCALCAWAQSGIEVPGIGVIVDSSRDLRPVHGVAGSFLLGPASLPGALTAACSPQLCLVKTDSKILSATGETDAPPGPAIFGFSGDNATVFFPEVHIFARWHNDVLEPLGWVIEGDGVSIRLVGNDAEIAVRREGQVWIVRPDGSVIASLGDASGPMLLLPKGVVLATKDKIVLRQDRSEVSFELAETQSITALGAHYAAIHVAGGAIYALRTDAGREGLFLLPGNIP